MKRSIAALFLAIAMLVAATPALAALMDGGTLYCSGTDWQRVRGHVLNSGIIIPGPSGYYYVGAPGWYSYYRTATSWGGGDWLVQRNGENASVDPALTYATCVPYS